MINALYWTLNMKRLPFYSIIWSILKPPGRKLQILVFPMLCLPVIKHTISWIHDINNAWNFLISFSIPFLLTSHLKGERNICVVDEPGMREKYYKLKFVNWKRVREMDRQIEWVSEQVCVWERKHKHDKNPFVNSHHHPIWTIKTPAQS